MSSPLVLPTGTPVCVPSDEALAAARQALATGDSALWQRSDAELTAKLQELTALIAQAQAAVVATTGEAFARGTFEPARRTASSWLSQVTRMDTRQAKQLVELGDALRGRYELVSGGMRAGTVSVDHARVIVTALEKLPRQVDDDDRADAEEALVGFAADLTPWELAKAARALHEQLAARAPDIDDPEERELLEREQAAAEKTAAERRSFLMRQRTDGAWDGRLRLPAEAGAAVQAALECLAGLPPTAPGEDPALSAHVPDATDDAVRDDRTKPQKLADALHELCAQVLDSGQLPEEGGERPHMHVTVRWETLIELAEQLTPAGMFDVGGTLGVAETRRLLCDARIIPVVLGGAGEVLDIGRSTRVWTTAQRRAVAARDGGCAFPGCYKPIRATHIHHMHHWSKGGPTSVDNGALLCLAHHRQVHLQGWEMRLARNGLPELIPPASLDPQQRPRQHERFRIRSFGR